MAHLTESKTIPGGTIILTASVAGRLANAGSVPYSASKAAVVSMAQTAAYEYTGRNVRVNAICPGLIETTMTMALFDMARARGTIGSVGQLNPLLRYGHPIGAYQVSKAPLTRRDRPGCAVACVRRCQLCQWPADSRRWRADCVDSVLAQVCKDDQGQAVDVRAVAMNMHAVAVESVPLHPIYIPRRVRRP